MSWGIDAIAWIGHQVTSWPGAIMQVPSLNSGALALVSIGGLWFCIWIGRWRWWGMVPVALGFLSLAFIRPPDMLVSGDMKLIAVRDHDGAYLPSNARVDPLVQDTWTKRAAASLGNPWPKTGSLDDDMMSCDAEGCIYRARGQTVALIRDGVALAEDCRTADLVVSPVAAHQVCRATPSIDRIDTLEKGGHAVWLDPRGITIVTVRQWQGARPWTPKRYQE
jgi:competence protein ComEC